MHNMGILMYNSHIRTINILHTTTNLFSTRTKHTRLSMDTMEIQSIRPHIHMVQHICHLINEHYPLNNFPVIHPTLTLLTHI